LSSAGLGLEWLVDVLVLVFDPLLHRPNALAALAATFVLGLCWLTAGGLTFGVVSLGGADAPDPQSEASPHPFFAAACGMGAGSGVSGISSVGSGGSVSPRIDALPLPSVDDEGSPIAFSAMTGKARKLRQSPIPYPVTPNQINE
jgi:hypothetical protein